MKKNNQFGFTLIELLVVISIIGLLSTLAVISLNSARAKSRDAKRISDVKNLSDTLRLIANDNSDAPFVAPCDAANASVLTCVGGNPGNIDTEFIKYRDPSFADDAAANLAPCDGTNSPCQYSIGNAGATVSDATILFSLEAGTANLPAGQHSVTDGSFQ